MGIDIKTETFRHEGKTTYKITVSTQDQETVDELKNRVDETFHHRIQPDPPPAALEPPENKAHSFSLSYTANREDIIQKIQALFQSGTTPQSPTSSMASSETPSSTGSEDSFEHIDFYGTIPKESDIICWCGKTAAPIKETDPEEISRFQLGVSEVWDLCYKCVLSSSVTEEDIDSLKKAIFSIVSQLGSDPFEPISEPTLDTVFNILQVFIDKILNAPDWKIYWPTRGYQIPLLINGISFFSWQLKRSLNALKEKAFLQTPVAHSIEVFLNYNLPICVPDQLPQIITRDLSLGTRGTKLFYKRIVDDALKIVIDKDRSEAGLNGEILKDIYQKNALDRIALLLMTQTPIGTNMQFLPVFQGAFINQTTPISKPEIQVLITQAAENLLQVTFTYSSLEIITPEGPLRFGLTASYEVLYAPRTQRIQVKNTEFDLEDVSETVISTTEKENQHVHFRDAWIFFCYSMSKD